MKKILVFLGTLLLVACTQQADAKVIQASLQPSIEWQPLIERQGVIWELLLIDNYNDEQHKVVLNEYGYFENRGQSLNEEELQALAKTLASGIDTPLKNASLSENDEIIPGQSRVILSEKETVELILDLKPSTKELTLPIYVTEPNINVEDIEGIDELVIGEFTTYFDSGVAGRTMNIKLSSDEIDRVILGPGDTFSFNSVVGERTKDRGYQEALEIINKEFVMGIGGGICQTSSTLYNAVEQAGLEITERYTHSREIGYVPKGRDATVSWGGPDFKFKNSFTYPIMLKTEVINGSVQIQVVTQKINREV
ncbi:VanW family protein [Alkalihalobacillus pseudalcaliphilus]|uniref:VanW family protein n=1 Tax=Alkalihalobacillus pseudalcaliphilus TaxID=79884 RepID=UPI00064DFA0A|nr:VanW family protein [Alkalihalobacillus pseudalcaliphilus]KMK76489.1 vancomycin resistance protein [Alkalihalobacillus pseudalcaliphilus]